MPKTSVRISKLAGIALLLGAQSCGRDGAPAAPLQEVQTYSCANSQRALCVGELSSVSLGTTPTDLPIELVSDLDQMILTAQIIAPGNVPVTTCQTYHTFRVGPDAIDWPRGESLTLPLAYPETLPDGLYSEEVHIGITINLSEFETGNQVFRDFEIIDGKLWPLATGQYFVVDAAGNRIGSDNVEPKAVERCPPLPALSDEIEPQRATSILTLEDWSGLGSIQPLRWIPPATPGDRGQLGYKLLDSSSTVLVLQAVVPPDVLSTGATLALDSRSATSIRILDSRLRRSDLWSSSEGTLTIHPEIDGRMTIDFADVVMTNDLDARITRSPGSGQLVGALQTVLPYPSR